MGERTVYGSKDRPKDLNVKLRCKERLRHRRSKPGKAGAETSTVGNDRLIYVPAAHISDEVVERQWSKGA
jgi:hypothetical protein